MKAKDALLLALTATGVYLAWRLLNAASAVPRALTTAGEAIGGTLFDWINPGAAGESLFYVTQFMDGSKHAIPSLSVDASGHFVYNGVPYLMKSSATIPHIAMPA